MSMFDNNVLDDLYYEIDEAITEQGIENFMRVLSYWVACHAKEIDDALKDGE